MAAIRARPDTRPDAPKDAFAADASSNGPSASCRTPTSAGRIREQRHPAIGSMIEAQNAAARVPLFPPFCRYPPPPAQLLRVFSGDRPNSTSYPYRQIERRNPDRTAPRRASRQTVCPDQSSPLSVTAFDGRIRWETLVVATFPEIAAGIARLVFQLETEARADPWEFPTQVTLLRSHR